jgi:hypothetical protein
MSAPLAILRAGRYELGAKTLRFVTIASPAAVLALGMAVAWVPVAGHALAAEVAARSPAPADQFPAALTPPYPDASDPAALGRWFGQTTHLPAKSILAITDNAIFAAFPQHTSGPFWTVDVRLESITPQSTEKLGGRSIRLRLNVRCDNNTVRLNFLDAYPGADLTGAPTHRAPVNDWALPKPNSYVADAVRLACDKTFQGPLATVADAAHGPKAARKAALKAEAAAGSTQAAPALRARQPLTGAAAVQIGAYSTPGMADGAWRTLKAAIPDKTSGLSNATTRVEVGGRIFYRAIVQGFPSGAAAAAFCQTLRASGRACLIAGGVRP